MALTTAEAAYNTALIALIVLHKAANDAATTGATQQMVAVDIGSDSATDPQTHAIAAGDLVTAGTGLVPSFNEVHSWDQVNNGEYPHTLPNGRPLFYAYTNQAHDLA